MKPERLQEIKEEWCGITDGNMPKSVEELIYALEASQQQLAEAQHENKKLDSALDRSIYGCNIQEGRANRKTKRITELNKEIADLRAQLAASQAEVERLRNTTTLRVRDSRIGLIDDEAEIDPR